MQYPFFISSADEDDDDEEDSDVEADDNDSLTIGCIRIGRLEKNKMKRSNIIKHF